MLPIFQQTKTIKYKQRVNLSQPSTKQKQYRISPSKSIKTNKKILTKQDMFKINLKINQIKQKVMRSKSQINNQNCKTKNQKFQVQGVQSEDQGQKQKGTIVRLIKSKYNDRPSTIFFQYPKQSSKQQNQNYKSRIQTIQQTNQQRKNFKYKINGSQYKCIVNVLQFNGFQRGQNMKQCNVYFDIGATLTQKLLQNINKNQKINHFSGCWQIGRKDCMYKNLNKIRRLHPSQYNFVPTTYLLPNDYQRFQFNRQNSDKNSLWIYKPANSACGRGIKILKKDTVIKNKKQVIISQYIMNPHLINNLKYDLRLYVLVTSYNPLRIYLHQQGLVRFATNQYSTKSKDIGKKFIHLTNFSINKHSKKFVKVKGQNQGKLGSKWSLSALKQYYNSIGVNFQKVFMDIQDVIIKTCISVQPNMLDKKLNIHEKRNCGFQLYGFDILIDNNFKPWLIQVNICPSLSSSSPMDRKIKHTLMTDILNTIGLTPFNIKQTKIKQIKKDKIRLYKRNNIRIFSKNVNNLQNLDYQNCIQLLNPQDWQILFQTSQQLDRCGSFKPIFPIKQTISKYKRIFQYNRYNNILLWKFIQQQKRFLNKLYQ